MEIIARARIPDANRRIGEQIRRRRRILGMTQSELANALGVSYQLVQKYEKGDYRIGPARLNEIANVIGLPIQSLSKSRSRRSAQAEALQRFAESYEGIRLLRAMLQIQNGTSRRRVIRAIEALKDYPVEAGGRVRQLSAHLIRDGKQRSPAEKDTEAVQAIAAIKRDMARLIGQGLKAQRFTQKSAAVLLNCNQPKISALANGDTRRTSFERLLRYALLLDWTAELKFRHDKKSNVIARARSQGSRI